MGKSNPRRNVEGLKPEGPARRGATFCPSQSRQLFASERNKERSKVGRTQLHAWSRGHAAVKKSPRAVERKARRA